MFSLQDRVALVTGGGRGIGRGLALGLAEAGAHVAVAARTVSQIEDTAAQVRARGRRALAIPTDVRNSEQVKRMVQRTVEELGGIDILINNAGASARMPLMEMKEEIWDAALRANLKSVFLCCQAVGPWMQRQGKGNIINISSLAGLVPEPGDAHYAAAKAGVVHFTRTLAQEWAPYNIRVNCIAPGFIDTPGTEKFMAKAEQAQPGIRKFITGKIPLGRTGKPEDIVGAAIFFASDASSYVTGETLLVGGGLVSAL